MDQINREWINWDARRQGVGNRILVGSAILLLFSFLLVSIAAAGLANHLSNQQNEHFFYLVLGFLLPGIALLPIGGLYKRHFGLPRDIDDAPISQRFEGEMIASKSDSLVTRAIVSVSLLVSSFFVWYVGTDTNGHPNGLFPLGLVTLIVGAYALVGLANKQRYTKITIDCATRSISFTRSFSREPRVYCFGELDGFLYVEFPGGYRDHPRYVVSLVKQGRRVESISSDVYRNFCDLKQGLASLRQLRISDTLPVGCSRTQLLC